MINIIAYITNFTDWYSLCTVIASQARALSYVGEDVIVWTHEDADVSDWPDDIDVRAASICDASWYETLDGPVILHDTVFIDGYKMVGEAAAAGLTRPHFAWFHSGVTTVNEGTWNEHTEMVVLNPKWKTEVERLTGQPAHFIPNPLDLVANASTDESADAMRWATQSNDVPLMMVSAFQGRRWRAKGVDTLIATVEYLRRLDYEPVCFLCVADPQPCMINRLSEHQVLDRSFRLIGDGYNGAPRRVVQDLLRMSDIHVNMSLAEASSMMVTEATAAGNLVFYNRDCYGMSSDRPERSIPVPPSANEAAHTIASSCAADRAVVQRLRQRARRGLRPYGLRLASLLGARRPAQRPVQRPVQRPAHPVTPVYAGSPYTRPSGPTGGTQT